EFLSDPGGFSHIAAPNAQVAIDHRRVVKDKEFFARWRTVFRETFKFRLGEMLCQLRLIGDGCGTRDEIWSGSVKLSDTPEASQNVGEMASKDAAISVQLVEHDVPQIFEEPGPASVVGKNTGVQHIGIREDDMTAIADRSASVRGRVAVVGE